MPAATYPPDPVDWNSPAGRHALATASNIAVRGYTVIAHVS